VSALELLDITLCGRVFNWSLNVPGDCEIFCVEAM
jgi:hypothetical protein